MTSNDTTPRIYIACLACYNDGKLHGEWVDATQDAESIDECRAEMQRQCGHTDNDWAIHDSDNFEGARIAEHDDFSHVSELANLIQEHGAAYVAYMNDVGAEYATEDQFTEDYCGEWSSEEAFTEETFRESGNTIPAELEFYVDWEKMAHDWFINDYSSARAANGNVFVFRRS